MSSIAYLSDENMLEFHRTKGNQSMNFWRISIKNFERFAVGDLLFFVDKRHLHPETKEKGIIGYGRVSSIRTMSVNRTWKQYETLNGYPNYERFKESILNLRSDLELPKQIQSIHLEEVVFSKAPIYLSELNFDLPKQLESFIYLEQEGNDLSSNILRKIESLGVDNWFTMMTSKDIDIQATLVEQKLRNIINKVNVNWTQTQEKTIKQANLGICINMMAYQLSETGVDIYLPVSSIKNQFYEMLGIKAFINANFDDYKIKFHLVSKTEFNDFELLVQEMNLEPVYI